VSDSPAAAPVEGPQLGGPAYLRLIGLGAAIGVPAALVAVAFLGVVHVLENWLWHSLPDAMGLTTAPWWMVLGLPVLGGLLVWAARTLLPGDGGHEPLGGISLAATAVAHVPSVALAAVATLAFGAVLGPEGPLIALGSGVGMVAVGIWKVTGPGAQVLSTAGAFSAVSALFGGPVVAGALLLEAGVGLGAALIPALLPGAVAAAIGYVIIVGVGSWSGIPVAGLTIPELAPYVTTRIVDLLLAVVAGLVVALLVHVVRTLAVRLRDTRSRVGSLGALLGGALVVGLLALGIEALGGASSDVLFSGQTALPALLAQTSEWLLLAILLAKAIGYAICLGVGFRGGPVFPAIFVGVGVALLVGHVADMSPTAALAIGTASGMAAFTRLIFASLVFVLLICGTAGVGAIPAAVLAAATAWVVGKVLDDRRPITSSAPAT
jgi:H+/Cl- antiporter ClcA